ncbi:sugar dehydrogenase complex small subunit [Brucellaceae bacterium C25G]
MPSHKVKSSSALTRRTFLGSSTAASLLALFPLPVWAATSVFDVNSFMKLSEKQLGQTGLSKDMATTILEVYSRLGKEDDLCQLAAGHDNQELSNSLVATWYTGESPNPDDLVVIEYTDALIWQAMDYTKPMGYCGGTIGYWSEPPEA